MHSMKKARPDNTERNEWMMNSSSAWAGNIKVWEDADWGSLLEKKWNSSATGERDTFVLTFLPSLGASCLLFGFLVPSLTGSHDAPRELRATLQVPVTCSATAGTSVSWQNKKAFTCGVAFVADASHLVSAGTIILPLQTTLKLKWTVKATLRETY